MNKQINKINKKQDWIYGLSAKKMAVVERWPLVAVHPSFPEIYDSVSNYYTQISLI